MTGAVPPQKAPSGELTIDALISIRHPSAPAWSPDGERVVFVWDRAGTQNLFLVDARGGWPKALTSYRSGVFGGAPFWGREGRTVYVERDGELWRLEPDDSQPPSPVFGTDAAEGGVRLSPDGTSIAFIRHGDIWLRNLASGVEKRLTVTLSTESGLRFSPDGQRLAFTYSRGTPRQETDPLVGEKIAFRRFERGSTDLGVVSVSGGPVRSIAEHEGLESQPRWVDGGRITFQRVSPDGKLREVLLADVVSGELRLLHTEREERWWSLAYLGAEPKPSPDGRWVAFVSEASGWDRLLLASTGDGGTRSLTPDGEEVRRFAWSPDSSRIAFDTNREQPGRRQLAIVTIATGQIEILTEGAGTNLQPADVSGFGLVRDEGGWSPNGERILFQHTDPHRSADIFWIEPNAVDRRPHELTMSLSITLDRSSFVTPQLVHYPSRDGREVPAYLFVPPELDRERKHPAIVWVHGDGIAQNYEGWHPRRDYAVYYSFHQYLAQQGYVVLAPDYRGSIGYGKAWRQAPYRDLGGGDFEDVVKSVDYLDGLLFVDRERVGVWGLSYGGFLTLQVLTSSPRSFACGIDVAGVHDFRFWHRDPGGRWIDGRMGSPEENAEAYRRAAPVERVARLERPLLVLHGTADVNVPFLESLRLVDALVKEGKEVELAVYPGEFHYFHREHVLRDAWRRVETFFSRHLGGAATEKR